MPPDPPSRGVAMPHLFVVILRPWPDHSNFACYGPSGIPSYTIVAIAPVWNVLREKSKRVALPR